MGMVNGDAHEAKLKRCFIARIRHGMEQSKIACSGRCATGTDRHRLLKPRVFVVVPSLLLLLAFVLNGDYIGREENVESEKGPEKNLHRTYAPYLSWREWSWGWGCSSFGFS